MRDAYHKKFETFSENLNFMYPQPWGILFIEFLLFFRQKQIVQNNWLGLLDRMNSFHRPGESIKKMNHMDSMLKISSLSLKRHIRSQWAPYRCHRFHKFRYWFSTCFMSGSSHIRSVLIGVKYRNCRWTFIVLFTFCYLDRQIQSKLPNELDLIVTSLKVGFNWICASEIAKSK